MPQTNFWVANLHYVIIEHSDWLFKVTWLHSAWIAEWSSHSTLKIGTLCPGPWVQALVTSNSFSDPSTTSMLYSWFYLICLIQYYYLSVKFVLWIVKQKIENKRIFFFKKVTWLQPNRMHYSSKSKKIYDNYSWYSIIRKLKEESATSVANLIKPLRS